MEKDPTTETARVLKKALPQEMWPWDPWDPWAVTPPGARLGRPCEDPNPSVTSETYVGCAPRPPGPAIASAQ